MAASPAISSFDGIKRPPGPKSFGGHHQVQFKTAPAPPTPDSTDFRRRRAHTKSRAGCAACKKRHIQCDEGKPTCTNCLVRGSQCSFRNEETHISMRGLRGWDRPSSSGTTDLSHIFSGVPADPFDTLPIEMVSMSPELFHHFVYCQTRVRALFPRHPYNFHMDTSNSTFFRTALVVHGTHKGFKTVQQSEEALKSTCVVHKGQVIHSIKQQVETPLASDLPDWLPHVILGLICATLCENEAREAEAHLHGLLTVVDSIERQRGRHLYIDFFRRKVVMISALMWASAPSHAGVSSRINRQPTYPYSILPPSPEAGDPVRAWGDAPYLFSHLALEYQSHSIYTNMTSREKYVRRDVQLFKWLYGSLSKARSDIMLAPLMASAPEGSSKPYRPPSPGAIEEVWVWRTVIGAYALVFGNVSGRKENAPENRPDEAQDDDWLAVWMRQWKSSGIPMSSWPWSQVLDRICWLGTDPGIAYVESLWKDATDES